MTKQEYERKLQIIQRHIEVLQDLEQSAINNNIENFSTSYRGLILQLSGIQTVMYERENGGDYDNYIF